MKSGNVCRHLEQPMGRWASHGRCTRLCPKYDGEYPRPQPVTINIGDPPLEFEKPVQVSIPRTLTKSDSKGECGSCGSGAKPKRTIKHDPAEASRILDAAMKEADNAD